MFRVSALVACLGATACNPTTTATVQADIGKAVAAGQLFCAKATALGPIVVALATAAGAPVIVTGAASADVAAACAVIGAIPVAPPVNAAEAPVVAAAVMPLKVTTP
jgi:hypothetical protein